MAVTLHLALCTQGYRNLLARAMSETLAVYSAAGITTVSTTPLPMWMVPYLFRLPDFIFSVAAASILSIDETARSSMVLRRLQAAFQ